MVRHCPASQSLITQIQIGLSVYKGGGGGGHLNVTSSRLFLGHVQGDEALMGFMQGFPGPCAG